MKNRRRRIGTGSADSSSGGQLLALSLFVMLLAFFIVLNAISNYEQSKVKPVLQSLEAAFASKIMQAGNSEPSITESAQKSINEGDVLDRLQSLFEAQIPSYNGKIDRNTGTMYVEVSFDDFENAVMSMGVEEKKQEESESAMALKGFFLPALVSLVRNDIAGKSYRMDVLVNIEDDPALMENTAPQQLKEIMARISALAGKIEKGGLPQKFMSIGLKQGKADSVELLFRPHIPYNPMEKSDG